MKIRYFIILWTFLLSACCYAQGDYLYPRGILEGEDTFYEQIPQKSPLTRGFYVGCPTAFSLKQFAPTPKSQKNYGTCTGWACAYAARTILEAQKNGWTNDSTITENAFSPTFQYRIAASNRDSCQGAYTSDVVESLKSVGSVPMKDFYTIDGQVLCPTHPLHGSNLEKAKKHQIEGFTTLWKSGLSDGKDKVLRVKMSISEGNPVVISMICPDSFDKVGKDGLWAPTEDPDDTLNGRQHGRHALCVIGYDNEKYGGAFEIQNSWDTWWGNNGYVWIKYTDFSRFAYQAFELLQFPQPEPYQPLLAGSLRLYDMDDDSTLHVELAEISRNWSVVGPEAANTYQVVESLLSGSKMRMYLKSEAPAYVYMLGTGSVDKTVVTLFPVEGLSPAMNYSEYEVALPSEDHYFYMDNTIGKDYIIVIFSKEELDIETIRNTVENGSGNLSKRFDSAIHDVLIDPKYITFKENEIKFEVKQNETDKKAFAMIIEFDHFK
nr:hypothetical protein [Bacteroidota bacterium]